MAFKNEKEFALGGSHTQDNVGAWFFYKKIPIRKYEFFNKNKLGYIGESCFSSVDLTKFAILWNFWRTLIPKKWKMKKMGIICS